MTTDYPTGETVARAFFDAWNAGDADAIASLFTPDADFVNVVGIWWTSARQIRKAHDYGFRRIFQNAQLTIMELKVRELTTDIHIVHTVSTLDGQTSVNEVSAGRRIAVISMVTIREPGGFRIVSCQNTDRVEGADTHLNSAAGLRPVSYATRE
ncbi:SgcJ/EcaC family oxidoreductase [Cognatiyoonia sp. IB215182]|uniref:SgcJ/EcaC family oxidoreductase n=1 Tax=Cognatiyoonia sp. IB215182 TaxID=3097353 RepID=UPI002A1654B8|nr:SgcJ/EcaC family oxidoreductase [Cognatiyoonia sp. IB215182]MDX8352947.1 SgcJ/EcaC family oxidoreductase [Cognatiyoonia sp. IB215182]